MIASVRDSVRLPLFKENRKGPSRYNADTKGTDRNVTVANPCSGLRGGFERSELAPMSYELPSGSDAIGNTVRCCDEAIGKTAALFPQLHKLSRMSAMSRFRVLFLAANPLSTTRLALDEELHTIQQRLRTSGAADRVELCAEWALRAEELPVALMRHRPRVVHFSGHGSVTGELLFISNQSSEIPSPVSPDTLRRIFQALAGSVQCVVLNACYSLMQAQSLTAILPCVVGMNRAVEDKAAIAFAAGFYEALTFGRSIKSAFELGCSQIELVQYISQRDIPELLFRRDIDADRFHIFQHKRQKTITKIIKIVALCLKSEYRKAI